MKNEQAPSTLDSRNEIQLAVMAEKVSNIEKKTTAIEQGISDLQHSIDNGYARKGDLDELRRTVSKMESQRDWAVKLIIGAVIISILALLGLRP